MERQADGHCQVVEMDGTGQQQQGNIVVHVGSFKVFVANYVGNLYFHG